MFYGPYTHNSFLSQFPELVMSRRGNLEQICQEAGLIKEMVTEPNTLIPFERFIRLLEVTETELEMPLVALELAQRQDASVLGPLSTLLTRSQNLAEAMNNVLEYFSLIISGVKFDIKIQQEVAELCFQVDMPELAMRPQFQNYLLASSAMILRHTVSRQYNLRGVFFTRDKNKEDINQFSRFFRCPVTFNADCLKITADKALLNYPVDAIRKDLIQQITAQIHSPKQLIQQIEKIIAMNLASGAIDLKTIARAIGYSPRTLHRQLEKQGTSFRALLETTRYSQANQYLANGHYSLNDISALLGYNNQSAFTRSYKRWNGETPQAVRARSQPKR